MQYRSRPVSVAVDPVSLVIAECIAITSAIQKHARSPHSSVAAILGGGPSPVQLGPANSVSLGKGRSKTAAANITGEGTADLVRWGLRGKKGKSMQDNPLISGFGRLRHELTGIKDIHKFDALTMLYPFLQIVQAKGTAAPVTILALRAIRKFLAYGFVSPESPRFAVAMQSLSAAVTHCQFDISDPAQEEVVLLMILHLMEDMLSGPGGDILSDESVCDMMGRGLTICSRPRFSEVLRQTAEASMVRMCQIIFEDLKHLEEEAGEESDALDRKTNGDMDTVNMDPSANGTDVPATAETTDRNLGEPRPSESESADSSGGGEADRATIVSETGTADSLDLRPYSLPSVRELFRVLVNFLDPHDRKHPDTMRVMALRIIHVALEVAGPSIARHPALASIAEDRLCFHLFQLIRSDHTAILQESLLVAGTLLSTCRGVLKLQQEKFLSYLVACLHVSLDIPREPGIDPSLYADIPQTPKLVKPPPSQVSSGRSTPVPVKERQKLGLEGGARKPDARQAMVENICVLARLPTFLVELFVNYDCDPNLTDLCEDMVGMLSRNALPDSATWSTTSVPPLCLDALLRYIQNIAERLDLPAQTEGYPDPTDLREQRRKKKLIIKGMSKFNENPRGGLAFLQDKGIIESATDPQAVATFLKSTTLASKKVLGEYLSKRGNEAILDCFMNSFDFADKRVDEALRMLLETFRLPGEAPLIDRIVGSFSKLYCAASIPGSIANNDAAYVLTYATIMLNTDQHNPNVKGQNRMKVDDFAKNLRGVNGGKDFDAEYLQAVYDAIRTNEIILPEEHDNKHALDYAWKELLTKTDAAGPLVICETNIFDADMFAATWRPIVSTLSYVFMSATDDTVFMRIVSGFDECARIAAKYNITEALDQIIYSLSLMTTLSTEIVSNTSLNTEVQVDDRSVMVSELAVKLGRNFRAQLAILVLFRVVTSKEHIIRKGWKDIIRIWLNLFVNSLISFSSDRSKLSLSPIPLRTPQQVVDRAAKQNDTGLFSAFSNFINSYAADEPPEPSQEELDSTLSTVDCINQCQMGDIFTNISNLPDESLEALVDALLEQIPEDAGSEAVITVKADNMPPSSPALAQKPTAAVAYDPGLVYILELSTVLALRDDHAVRLLGKRVIDAHQAILRDLSQHHPIIIARTTFYLFRLLQASYEYDFIRVPVLLHTVSSFPPDTLRRTSKLVLQGLKLCIDEPGPLRNEIMTSPDFWAILRALSTVQQVAPMVFEILETGVNPPSTAIMADNYEAAITLLNNFASAASTTVTKEPKIEGRRQPQRRPASRPPTAKPDDAKENPIVQRGIKAVNIIYSMTSRIPQLMSQSHLETNEAWSAYWLPIFEALTTQCTNPRREVRQLAFNSLQRALFSPELTSSDHREWTAIFGEVLFPLILRLLKPEVFSSDKDGMSETRVQAASLLCKVFLQYLVLLSEWDGMLDLWLKIIDIMDRLMNSGQGDSLEEAVPENLKNVLLFMSSNGYLVPPSQDPSKEKLWSESWKRIDRFLPELRKDLALDVEIEQPVKAEPGDFPASTPASAPAASEENTEEKAEEKNE
ncbi:GDP/GTP exchange factor for ARF [Gnomoniopsis smithogilvyi]|uniref:GDP/GTP exchange factor for ARF n=1 Tax=Gnomoniopsis smithogilvyi TaxID=1191159 RepID=A0A9W8YR50_9PEZI|nr:GDP/GTP exchange factor for ARF [Gnomoniopsis smithogilvyi]